MVLIIIFSNFIFGIIISIQMKDLRIIVSYQEQIYALYNCPLQIQTLYNCSLQLLSTTALYKYKLATTALYNCPLQIVEAKKEPDFIVNFGSDDGTRRRSNSREGRGGARVLRLPTVLYDRACFVPASLTPNPPKISQFP